jgi:ubiquitin-conjugating enzyme E2 variant
MLNLLVALIATLNVAIQLFSCLLVADFLSGLLHWFEDTWLAPGTSAFLDRVIIEPNIDHHRRPGGIREGSYWINNVVCISMTAAAGAVLAAGGVHGWQPYVVLLIASQSNQLHAWAHTSNPPTVVTWLQRMHLLQTAKEHAVHHRRPYAQRYCTTTSFLNPILDRSRFWYGLEWVGERLGAKVVRATPARQGF